MHSGSIQLTAVHHPGADGSRYLRRRHLLERDAERRQQPAQEPKGTRRRQLQHGREAIERNLNRPREESGSVSERSL